MWQKLLWQADNNNNLPAVYIMSKCYIYFFQLYIIDLKRYNIALRISAVI